MKSVWLKLPKTTLFQSSRTVRQSWFRLPREELRPSFQLQVSSLSLEQTLAESEGEGGGLASEPTAIRLPSQDDVHGMCPSPDAEGITNPLSPLPDVYTLSENGFAFCSAAGIITDEVCLCGCQRFKRRED